ncbi:MAG TPA: alpha/beta fold hydrolase [Acetobacteraceae bacterium]|nr:alpha/beta fold hydrolase [Acetobacteraceae bacterium]
MLLFPLNKTFRARLIRQSSGWLIAVLLSCLAIAGCTTPIGVERVDPQIVYREQTRNVLAGGDLSESTRIVLTRWDLNDRFATDPQAALAALQAKVADGTAGSDEIFALAELSFQHARQTGQHSYYLAAAVYAFAFLFPDGIDPAPNPYDPRLRTASDLYNRALTAAFASADGTQVQLQGGEFALPFGKLRVAFDPASLIWAGRKLVDFVPIDEFKVYGLRNTYRQSGIGAPLAAGVVLPDPERGLQVAPRMKIPVTAVLRIADARRQLAAGTVDAVLEVHTPSDAESVRLGGQDVPLEIERTAALAYGLGDPEIWGRELRGFLIGDLLDKEPTRLVALGPYRPGRFPVVLIHGTASSAARWANTVNELLSDPRIREHFQFWAFSYDTGNPIPYSALLLREALRDAVAKVDPAGTDPALRRMVVIGYSQGGLLAKMLAVDSGTRFWDAFSRKPLDELNIPPETRDLARRTMFFEHSPFVSRVIFLATPQRGSYVAGFSVVQLISRLVRLPLTVARAMGDVLSNNADALRFDPNRTRIGNSVYGMTPGSLFITAVAPLPIAPGIAVHSIIAVQGDGPVETGDDGVVAYSSAHFQGADSELVVRSGHSIQSNPQMIIEVRRILLLHLKESCAAGVGCDDGPAAASVGRGTTAPTSWPAKAGHPRLAFVPQAKT